MIVQQTLTQLRELRLEGMAGAFEEQLTLPSCNDEMDTPSQPAR